MKLFLHGSRRSFGSLADSGLILDKIRRLATEGLQISEPLFNLLYPSGKAPQNISAAKAGTEIHADMAISLGGDGTFLRTTQWVGDSQVPILGVNAGHLGFLADMTPEEFLQADTSYIKSLHTEPRSLLQITSTTPLPDGCHPYALNDVALLKTDSASMISVHAEINGRALTTYQADGLIISTPTGSTGYNLSVGGPILEPSVNALVISPVAPHQLAMRPLVVGGDSHISLHVTARAGAFMLSLDGRSHSMPDSTAIEIRTAPFKIVVAQRPGHHFAATLRAKLLWGERPVNQ